MVCHVINYLSSVHIATCHREHHCLFFPSSEYTKEPILITADTYGQVHRVKNNCAQDILLQVFFKNVI